MRYQLHKMDIKNLHLSQNMDLLNNPTMDETEDEATDGRVGTCQLTMERCADIVALILWAAIGFTIPRGAFASVAKEALCLEKAVQNILTRLKSSYRASLSIGLRHRYT